MLTSAMLNQFSFTVGSAPSTVESRKTGENIVVDLTRRALFGAIGLGIVGTVVSWPRLTGADIPGRGKDVLTVALFGTAQDAVARQSLIEGFQRTHPGIEVRIVAIQGQDWSEYFAKILTMIAAGTPPDVVTVATEGAQLFASRLAHPLDDFVRRDAAEMQEYFDDVNPTLIEAFMYQGSLFQMPDNFNAANVFYSTQAMERAGLERPADNWTLEDFLTTARSMKKSAPEQFLPYFWNNRLWGGVVPWLYVNNTSFLREEKAGGGDWFWDRFYPGQPSRSGGYVWEAGRRTERACRRELLRAGAHGLGGSCGEPRAGRRKRAGLAVLDRFGGDDTRGRILGARPRRGRRRERRL